MRSQKRFMAALSGIAVFGVIVPVWLALALIPPDVHRMTSVQTVAETIDLFKNEGFDPQQALRQDTDVIPAVFVANLPRDLKGVSDADLRKAVFVSIVLPHVLRADARILADRKRLVRLIGRKGKGSSLSRRDRLWLARLADRYGAKPGDTTTLLHRVDIVPPRLAVAQAAQESGWGTSRFAHAANALFGQRTDPGTDSVSAHKAEGVVLHAFDSLYDSVRSYIHNLNTHAAYRSFRAMRAAMRQRGERLDGRALATALVSYSEQGAAYVDQLHKLMQMPEVAASRNIRLATVN